MCEISVVISTYNRSRDLALTLAAVLDQDGEVPYEVVVVDNNSTDDTAVVVERARNGRVPVRYVFESRQGVSNGRNAGIRAARAEILAFTDDDVCPARDWVASIARAFERHPGIGCIGGKVLPRWPEHVPAWFTWQQIAPLALSDRGDREIVVDASHAAPCLIGANFACRRSGFEKAGLFSPDYLRTEDREIQLRFWRAGVRGLYVPSVVVWVDVPPERLTKEYYRMWYHRTGRFHARMGLLEAMDRDGRLVSPPRPEACLFGVPPYLYRELILTACSCAAAATRRRPAEAFYYENRVRYLASYVAERLRQSRGHSAGLRQISRFLWGRVTGADARPVVASAPASVASIAPNTRDGSPNAAGVAGARSD